MRPVCPSKSPQVLVATSHRAPSRTRWVAWSPYTPGLSGRRKNRSARCSGSQPSGSSDQTLVWAASKKPGPAEVAVNSSRPPSRTRRAVGVADEPDVAQAELAERAGADVR